MDKKVTYAVIEHIFVWSITLLFVTLKLNGVINWDWVFVFILPLLEFTANSVLAFLGILLIGIITINKE